MKKRALNGGTLVRPITIAPALRQFATGGLSVSARSEQAREAPGAKLVGEAVKRLNLGNPLPPDLRHLFDHNIHADLRNQL